MKLVWIKPFILVSVIVFSVLFRYTNYNFDDLWYDEVISFWIANPNYSLIDSFNNHNLIEVNSYAYHFILKIFFGFFGYSVDAGRLFSVFFGVLSIFSTAYLVRYLAKDNSYFLAIFLIGFNVYLIGYSQEMRVYSLMYFFSSLSLIFFFKTLFEEKKLIHIICFNLFNLTNVLLHPFSLLIVFSYLTYLFLFFIKNRNLNTSLLVSLLLTCLIAAIFYYQSLLLAFDNSAEYFWMTNPKLSFYTNYYFSSFFGSRLLGIIFLFTFLFFVLQNFKIISSINYLTVLLIIILLSYVLPLTYGYLFRPIFTPRYIIFILIPVISIISICSFMIKNIKARNSLIIFLAVMTIGNLFTEQTIKQFFKQRIPTKPEYTKAIDFINKSNIKNYSLRVVKMKNNDATIDAINNYINEINKNNNFSLNFITSQSLSAGKKFWYVCLQDINGKDCSLVNELIGSTILEEENFNNINLKLIEFKNS